MNSSKNAFLRNYTLKIQAGTKQQFGLRGGTLRIISASVPVFFESKQNSSAFYLEQGEEIILSDDVFFNLDIFHNDAADQTFIIAVSENAKIGSVKLSGNVAITNLQLDNGRIQVAPVAYSASFVSVSNLVANTPEAIFFPAANLNGALLWNAQYVSYNATALSRTSLIAKTTAPTSTVDGEVILSPQNVILVAGVFGVTANLTTPVKISAGKGLYFIVGNTETFGSRSLLYTLL